MLNAPGFPDYLGWLGILVGALWILNIFTKIFFPIRIMPGIVLFTFLLWVFLTGLGLIDLAV
ncbi:MAG: hypothetical protein GY800_05295 [Planctomycetes bacterium]|nr:hypothetical protein [Planctomycetota bacterium]